MNCFFPPNHEGPHQFERKPFEGLMKMHGVVAEDEELFLEWVNADQGCDMSWEEYREWATPNDVKLLKTITEASQEVFKELGSGHSEVIYEAALSIELLLLHSLSNRRQVPVTIKYRAYDVGHGFIDILVDDRCVIEIKSIAKLSGKDEQQVRKYLTATGLERGFLINFGNDLEIVEVRKGDHEQTKKSLSVDGGTV
jgi:GxxExxY protein